MEEKDESFRQITDGSYTKIDKIDLTKAKPYKDFGKAFYLTKFYEQAKIWADRLGREHRTDLKKIGQKFTPYC
jgi:hypothetical protein